MSEIITKTAADQEKDRLRDLRKLLQAAPPAKEIKERQGAKFIPISFLEDKLDLVFGDMNWQIRNLQYQVIINEISVSLELWFKHPISGEWIVRNGVGAAQIRCSALSEDQKAANKHARSQGFADPFPPIDQTRKIANSVEMDLPHAKADAFKNACQSIGKFFGRDLRRKDDETGYYYKAEMKRADQALLREGLAEIEAAETMEGLTAVCKKYAKFNNVTDWISAVTKRRNELQEAKP